MPKKLTIRLDDVTYQLIKNAAAVDNRSVSNFIGTAARQTAITRIFAKETELAKIDSDKSLRRRLKAGHRDAVVRRGRFA